MIRSFEEKQRSRPCEMIEQGDWRSRLRCAVWIAIAISFGFFVACGGEPEPRRVLIIGVDGATFAVIDPLMREGRLPNFAALARDGVSGILQSAPPFKSPRIWTTVATGKNPESHGITGFAFGRKEGDPRLVTSHDRRGHALWNIATDHGMSAATVNWWVTHPPEKINGVMVSDHFLPGIVRGREVIHRARSDSMGPVVYPEEWEERVSQILAAREANAESSEIFPAKNWPRWAKRKDLEGWYRDDESVGEVALQIAIEVKPDIMLVLFRGVDSASHILFATLFEDEDLPRPLPATDAERAAGRAALLRFYEHADEWVGRLMSAYSKDDLVIVVSDHGFEPRKRFGKLTGWHRSAEAAKAIIFARGAGIEAGGTAGKVDIVDITPTVLHWLGMPVAENMDGRPAAFVGGGEPRTIASYDGPPIERIDGNGETAEDEIMEQLEALGYFESAEPGEDGLEPEDLQP